MAYTKYGLYADPSFQLGMALGDAYGTMWASNAKKRNEAQMDDVVRQYMYQVMATIGLELEQKFEKRRFLAAVICKERKVRPSPTIKEAAKDAAFCVKSDLQSK